jgi:hypothetical protein
MLNSKFLLHHWLEFTGWNLIENYIEISCWYLILEYRLIIERIIVDIRNYKKKK